MYNCKPPVGILGAPYSIDILVETVQMALVVKQLEYGARMAAPAIGQIKVYAIGMDVQPFDGRSKQCRNVVNLLIHSLLDDWEFVV